MIVHLDVDCFFVAVERCKNPELNGKPVVVGGTTRGVVASASYEARKFGIHSAMPIWKARQLCPELLCVSTDMDAYKKSSQALFAYLEAYTPIIEKCSIDEGYLDFKHVSNVKDVVLDMQSSIERDLSLTVSLGISTLKTVSQIAGKLNKPKGFLYVEPWKEREFLAPLSIKVIPGFGKKTIELAHNYGIHTIAQLAELTEVQCLDYFGKRGAGWLELAQGRDSGIVDAEVVDAKSYGSQETLDCNTSDYDIIYCRLQCLLDQVMRRLRKDKKFGGVLEIKLRTKTFQTLTKSRKLRNPTNQEDVLYSILRELLNSLWKGQSIRMVGVSLAGITSTPALETLDLFDKPEFKVSKILDSIKDRFGEAAITRGHNLPR